MHDIIIIGGGAAGLFLAAKLSQTLPKGLNILLFEKTATIGNKLLLSGNGQCNFTHAGDMKDFSTKYGENYNFLKPALYNLSNEKLVNFFENLGVKTFIRNDLKVFPQSMNANDIKSALIKTMGQYPIKIATEHTLVKIAIGGNGEIAVQLRIANSELRTFKTKYLVLCTGGASFSETGSAGDIIYLLNNINIKTKQFKPSLSVPNISYIGDKKYNISELSGICLNSAILSIQRANKTILTKTGTLLFTHFGMSGPLILDNSRYFDKGDKLITYLTCFTKVSEFDEQLLSLINNNSKRLLKNVISLLNIPDSIIHFLCNSISKGILDKKASEISKSERNLIAKKLFSMEFLIKELGSQNEAMCSKGGVDLSEINKKNMSLKKYPNIFVAGECIDIDGDTGGYNIHVAFATANLIAEYFKQKE